MLIIGVEGHALTAAELEQSARCIDARLAVAKLAEDPSLALGDDAPA